MAKPHRFIQTYGSPKLRVRFQIEPPNTRRAGFGNPTFETAAADTAALAGFSYGHLRDFEFTRGHGEQSAAANRLAPPDCEEDPAAGIQNRPLRICERSLILRL